MYLENPLDEFNTYSVHYVMTACRTTVVAKSFAATDPQSVASSLAAIDATPALGQPVVLNNNVTDIFLVLDTRRFSQFSVDSLKYDVYINGLQKAAAPANFSADLSMVVLDSVGISFANFMQWIMDVQLKTNYDGLIFMLRVIFVGHKPDGSSEVVQSETIPMHLNKMEINLDYAKGAYNLEFMPNINFDVNRHSRFLSISLATTYSTGKGNTLGGIVQSLENALNYASDTYFRQVQDIYKNAGSKTDLGRKVKYMITLPSENWGSFEVLGATAGGAAETKWFVPQAAPKTGDKTATTATPTSAAPSGQLKETFTAVKPSLSIPKVLDLIFQQTPEVAKLGNFQTNTNAAEGFVTFYKYLVGITSDDNTVVVHVDVIEFKVPNIIAQPQTTKPNTSVVAKLESQFYTTTTSPTGIIKREPRNFVEYDYIFTGKNKDILNFDMKIQEFQFLLSSNIRIGDGALRGVADSGGAPAKEISITDKNSDLIYTRKYDPILLPLDTKAALQNFSNYTTLLKTDAEAKDINKLTQQYTKNLSMFYAGSPITVALTIRGNPAIMHKFNIGMLLQHPDSPATGASSPSGSTQTSTPTDAIGSSRAAYRANLESQILRASGANFEKRGDSFILKSALDRQSYATSPVFARINIKGPNVDFRTNEPISDVSDFATSVLSDNYYVVFKVSNIFQGHTFTQEMELWSHNIFGRTKMTHDDHTNANPGTH